MEQDGLRVLVVEDHAMIAEMLTAKLTAAGFCVVGVARTAAEGLALHSEAKPDLVLCDVQLLDGSSGIELTRSLRAVDANALVVILSAENEPWVVTEALDAGAAGYVAKSADTQELLKTIDEAVHGLRGVADRETYRKLATALRATRAPTSAPLLTPRELETLQLMATGVVSNQDLSAAMSITPKSVRSYVERIFAKLKVHRRGEAVAAGYRLGLIEPFPAPKH